MARQKDFIVIGSGVAGLTFALKVCKFGSVGIITKDKLEESATKYAQGGIASVMAADDSFELHVRDTICLLYTSPSPRDGLLSRMPSSA